jgi:hypothetical protein
LNVTVEEIRERLDLRLAPWVEKAFTMIEGRYADARAHAGKAVTDTLKRTEDGRATAAHARLSPSARAAENRLVELLDALAGPSVKSLQGLICDAREAFLADSIEFWKGHIPEDLWEVSNPRLTKAGSALIRGALVFNAPLRTAIGRVVQTTIEDLRIAVALAGNSEITAEREAMVLDAWETTARKKVFAAVRSALSNSDVYADRLAVKLIVKTDMVDDTPIEV